MSDEERPERRHRQPGRRTSDAADFTTSALAQAVAGDRLFPEWKKEDVIKWLTILSLAGTIAIGVSTWVSARFATRKEIQEQVKPVIDTLNAFRETTAARITRIEARQDTAEATRRLIPGFIRLQCLQLQRDRSESMAAAAGLPCDSLLQHSR